MNDDFISNLDKIHEEKELQSEKMRHEKEKAIALKAVLGKMDEIGNKVEKVSVPEINIPENKDYTSKIDEAIEAIKGVQVKVEPKINVKASDVKVSNDFSEIVNKLEELKSCFIVNVPEIKLPKSSNKDIVEELKKQTALMSEKETEDIEKEEPKKDILCYKVSDGKEPVTGYQYFGFINPEGGWYILFNDAIESQVRYKFGKDNYAEAWNNYANLDYKMYNEAIDEIKD